MGMLVKTNDEVVILSGKDKGKKGKITAAVPKKGTVIVEGVNVITKHVKPKGQGQLGSIEKCEAPIYACRVMIVCGSCSNPTKIGRRTENGKKIRFCKKCNATI